MKSKVIIDTNGLMIPGQFGIDIFSELEQLGFYSYIVPSASVKELERIIATGRGKNRSAAKIAISLLERCTIIDKNGYADNIIIEMAINMDAAVLTNDAELKKRLCSKGVTNVYLRDRTRLSI
ncbi:MAG: DNA-binding protein [Candidatus Methanoperedenaceae archaeon]|nr:MAG: DNA-binding protein [Candidatus Methanoperedenaceae archaeon]